jgi:hypothetical protein
MLRIMVEQRTGIGGGMVKLNTDTPFDVSRTVNGKGVAVFTVRNT